MSRLVCRIMLLVTVICAELLVAGPMAQAKGADPCPEPNNAFQAACYLGTTSDALGFIFGPDDTDAYRFEVLDFGVKARLELAEMPAPYRLHLADWNGRVIAESADQDGVPVLEHTLGPPGSYYVFVDSQTGAASDAAPYRLTTSLTYAGAVPRAVYANEFRSGQKGLCTLEWAGSSGHECEAKDGKFILSHTVQGSGPASIRTWGAWGPEVTDFTLVADARMTGDPVRNEVGIGFRARLYESATTTPGMTIPGFYGYRVFLNPDAGELTLVKLREGSYRERMLPEAVRLRDLVPVEADGVNRIVIRTIGQEIIVNVNGVEIVRMLDDWHQSGTFTFGGQFYGRYPLPTVSFDNALVTVP